MQTLRNYIVTFYERKILGYSLNQYLIIFVLCSIFLPYYFGFITMGIVILYLIFTKQLKNIILKTPNGIMPLVFSIYTICVSIYHENNIGIIQGLGIVIISIFIMFYRENIDKRLFTCIIDLCCLGSLCCFLWGILEYLSIIEHMGVEFTELIIFDSPKNRVNATFYNANFYAQLIQFFVLMCIYKILNTKEKHRILFYVATILCNLFALYLTGCRTGWLSFIFTLPIMFYMNGWKKTCYGLSGCIILAMFIVLMNPSLFPRFDSILSSFSVRVEIWLTAIKGIKDNLFFGLGIGGYILIFSKYDGYKANHAHNVLLDPMLSFGLVGLVIFITFMIPVCKEIYRLYKSKIDMKLLGLILCFVIAVLVHGIFNYSIMWSQTGIIFLLIFNAGYMYFKDLQS